MAHHAVPTSIWLQPTRYVSAQWKCHVSAGQCVKCMSEAQPIFCVPHGRAFVRLPSTALASALA
eukprot:3341826-Prymnesium_polylepis.2